MQSVMTSRVGSGLSPLAGSRSRSSFYTLWMFVLRSAQMASDAANSTNSTNNTNSTNSTNSTDSSPPALDFCPSPASLPLLSAYFLLYLLCFPVFLSVLLLLCRKRRSLSHSEAFTLNLLAMEALNLVGVAMFCYSIYVKELGAVATTGFSLSLISRYGRIFFHALTCVDRHLAVVRPIAFLRWKERGGVRGACVGSVWLLSVGLTAVMNRVNLLCTLVLTLVLVAASLALETFCAVFVLRALIRPAPGEGGGDRRAVSRSKRAALYTVAIILGVQLVDIFNSTLFNTLRILSPAGVDLCLLVIQSRWLELPKCLVLPLLFLHRAKRKP